MDPKRRIHYNDAFKKSAVLQHVGNHHTLADSAERLGITASMLCKWIDRYSPEKDDHTMNYEAEIIRLKDEMKALKQIVEKAFLKKYSIEEIIDRMIDEPEKFIITGELH
jgi:transposase-like protein